MGLGAQVEMGKVKRPKVRVPKRETQVGKEERLSGGPLAAESDLKDLRKSMERLELKKPVERESFIKVLGFQEETGNFRKRELPDHAMVIAQGWPSWTFALEGLGFRSVSTIASFGSQASQEEFQATEMGSTLVDKAELSPWLEANDVKGIIFVQGEQAFLEAAYHRLCSTYEFGNIMRIVFVCSDVSFTSEDGLRVSHSSAGGITDGEWTFYTQAIPLVKVKPSRVRRRLKHVLRTTEGAGSRRQLKGFGDNILSEGDLLKFGEEASAVSTRSVFERGDLVTRLLSREELMDAYDLELTVQASLKSHCKVVGKSGSKSFVKAVPTKVLRLVARDLIGRTMTENESRFVIPVSAVPVRHQDEVGGQKVRHLVNPSLDIAARPDDAEAEAEDWDKWLVSSYVCPYGKAPLVCRGSYDVQTHGPLFEGMRRLLIRRYR